ncbi:hypothetical protein PGB90_000269 [Kerria lacca]
MILLHAYINFIFIQILFNVAKCSNTASANIKKHAYTTSASWSGESKLKNFWYLTPKINDENSNLFTELEKKLTVCNDTYIKKINK